MSCDVLQSTKKISKTCWWSEFRSSHVDDHEWPRGVDGHEVVDHLWTMILQFNPQQRQTVLKVYVFCKTYIFCQISSHNVKINQCSYITLYNTSNVEIFNTHFTYTQILIIFTLYFILKYLIYFSYTQINIYLYIIY